MVVNTANSDQVLIGKVKSLPLVPGIYKFKNKKGEIIYVGKAKSLRNRVKSYFLNKLDVGSKTYALVQRINDIEFIEVLSELEALILEAELIKKYRPKYNIALKDDKSYLYIVIRREKLKFADKNVFIPKILTARSTDLQKNDTVFGPYADTSTARYIVKILRKLIPFRDCSAGKFNRYQKLGKPCLFGHIGLCSAPCIQNISQQAYNHDILKIKKILSGKSVSLVNSLKQEMIKASKNQQYERAGQIRDTVQKFEYISHTYKAADKYIENPYLVDDLVSKSLEELKQHIPSLTKIPNRIECYDISNISGKEAVGSMVVATDGRVDPSEYRKFKIKMPEEPNDFGMMREVLSRRLDNDWPIPDLIVLDGGKGQISAVMAEFNKLDVHIPLVGLAKRFETIVYYSDGEFVEKVLPRTNDGLKLLQRLRDEAHRFAQKYHHQLRLKKIQA